MIRASLAYYIPENDITSGFEMRDEGGSYVYCAAGALPCEESSAASHSYQTSCVEFEDRSFSQDSK